MRHARSRRHVPIGYRAGGFTRADVVTTLVVVIGILLLASILWPAYQKERRRAYRDLCRANLSEIGKAMIAYANDHDGILPVAGGQGTVWGPGLADWKAESRAAAFGFDPNGAGGEATIGSSLYLLVRSGQVSPDLFLCPKDKGTTAFQPETYGASTKGVTGVWDFGPDPARHCSYAYHMPYSGHVLTTEASPGVAMMADRNPWIDGPRQEVEEFSSFKPDIAPFNGTPEDACRGNASVHMRDGQNVLFLDGHVEFAMRAFCGLEDDNIYTSWEGKDKVRGTPPKPYQSQSADALDSLLLNDPPLKR